jgi:hypothetical protein
VLKSLDAATTKSVNSRKSLYLLLTIVGSIAPWYWLIQDPAALVSPMLFFGRAFANNIAITEATDLLISATAFLCFASIESKRLGSSQRSLGCLALYLSFSIVASKSSKEKHSAKCKFAKTQILRQCRCICYCHSIRVPTRGTPTGLIV